MKTTARKIISLASLSAVAGSAALAGPASAATFGQPVVSGPSEHIPFNFAAFKEPADMKLPKNYRIVRVAAGLPEGENAPTPLTAPKGFGIVTIGMGSGHQIGASVYDVNYAGKRSVRVKVY